MPTLAILLQGPNLISSITRSCHNNVEIRRFIAEVSYDGSDFAGWQVQSNKRSVQGTLNDVLTSIYNYPVTVCGASRTDKGVHSRGQIIHFDLPSSYIDEDTVKSIDNLNNILPNDIKFSRWSHAPIGMLPIQGPDGLPFHAIENAISKHYSYEFTASENIINPMTTRYRASLYNYKAVQTLDLEAFQNALNIFIGEHDFRAFGNRLDVRAKKSEEHSQRAFSAVRTIHSASITEYRTPHLLRRYCPDAFFSPNQTSTRTSTAYSDDVFYRVDIVLDGALYKMLRNIIAGCVEVGYGTMSLQELRTLLYGGSDRAGNRLVTAPACGLYLQSVRYNENVFYD